MYIDEVGIEAMMITNYPSGTKGMSRSMALAQANLELEQEEHNLDLIWPELDIIQIRNIPTPEGRKNEVLGVRFGGGLVQGDCPYMEDRAVTERVILGLGALQGSELIRSDSPGAIISHDLSSSQGPSEMS
jgi:hypothetical protein